jgi:DNA-binding NarL/FixJ family response regulator
LRNDSGNTNARPLPPPGSEGAPIRVILADSQAIFRVGIARILASKLDMQVVARAESMGQTLTALSIYPADVLLFEQGLSPTPAQAVSEIVKRAPGVRVVMLVNQVTQAETIDYLRRGVNGIVDRTITPELLARCLRKVSAGESWLDQRAVNWMLQAFRDQAAQLHRAHEKPRLSEKELLIVSGVARGLKNRDIAEELGTTEQVIKNYLRKIYGKLGLGDRLELALYTMHEHLLGDGVSEGPPPIFGPPEVVSVV